MTEIYGIIYKSTNKMNKKSYIGRTTMPLSRRIRMHINSSLNGEDNTYFHNAIKKYGQENFAWEIIAKYNSLEELNKAEIEMIGKYNTLENGYNLSLGGSSNAGYKYTKEQKRKNSEMKRGKHRSEETKKKISEAQKGKKSHNYGKHLTEKTKKKISEATMGNKNSAAKKYIVTTPEGKKFLFTEL